jgi:small neutral amino acid transporter SnatA (MarC family)
MSIDFSSLLLSFIPLFVAIGVLGVIPIISILMNLLIVWLVFRFSHLIGRVRGMTVSRAAAKTAAMSMVAITVMMIRVGLTGMLLG